MGGVGSFTRQNRTVYVGRIHVTDDIEEIVARHFAEWGQVERIRVLNTRGVAFITVRDPGPNFLASRLTGESVYQRVPGSIRKGGHGASVAGS
jgi:hypothetical protein